jgi:hypothetical protein
MYTNIDTQHAMETLRNIIPPHVLSALDIIMNNNVFQFSDTYWLQLDGTAMGTPPACTWATLYFSAYEDKLREKYRQWILFFIRYIDDVFGVWNWTGTRECAQAWANYQAEMQLFGKLKWDFTKLALSAVFLDLTLTINNGRIHSTLYEKELNLYLYLPPHSAHPPGVLKGLISGLLLRIIRLTSDPATRKLHVQRFFARLVARGYAANKIKPQFEKTLSRIQQQQQSGQQTDPAQQDAIQPATQQENPVFLHLEYHPLDPSSSTIQKLFETHVLKSNSRNRYYPPLAKLKNKQGRETGINCLIIAYHRPLNLGNILAPRKFDSRAGLSVSEHFRSTRRQPRGRHTHTHTHTGQAT